MKIKVRTTASGLIFLCLANFTALAQSATLSSPSRSGDQFQFNLQGDPYRHYVIQSSSNLHDWIPLTTNVSSLAIRPLSFAASNSFRFFRSAPFIRTNLVGKAIQTTGSFDLNGNNFLDDSFNSTNSALSTYGQYDPSKRSDAAELSFDQGLTNSLESIGYITVFGNIAIGPQAPLIIGSDGSIGSLVWIYGANSGVQPGKLSTDLNPYFPEVNDPFPNGGYSTSAPGETIYDYVFDEGNYKLTELSGKVLVQGNARVYVVNELQFTGQDFILIKTNASLELYFGGTNARLSGAGIINENKSATNFIYYGMPSNTNVDFGGNTSFAGIIYVPQARVTFGADEVTPLDLMGAIVARSLGLNRTFRFHYDEALQDLLLHP